MSDPLSIENEFLKKITEIIEEHISDEHFGVAELAREMGMSRSSVHRRVKSHTKNSVVLFISHIRLKHALDMLQHTSYTVSEVSYKVGFNSPSYFIKCFHDYYGYSPGEVGNRNEEEDSTPVQTNKKKIFVLVTSLFLVVVIVLLLFVVVKPFSSNQKELEKSIAVLPFTNESSDTTNVYFINGLREDILTKLGNISELIVISSTSANRYKKSDKSIKQIARELNVNYILEGSGQKTEDKVKLNLQLIVGETDAHIWADIFEKKVRNENIFEIQEDVAFAVAKAINVSITPEEQKRIEIKPTTNQEAWNAYLKGNELLNKSGGENLNNAIPYFEKALEHDNEFALAYAELAITYYLLDDEKKYTQEIIKYADKAILNDSQLDMSLIAKAYYYLNQEELDLAVPFLEKALEYNPNSSMAIGMLKSIYRGFSNLPDVEKYLEYALLSIKINIEDSVQKVNDYISLADAFRYAGFFEETEKYLHKATELDNLNLSVKITKAHLLFGHSRYKEARELIEPFYDENSPNGNLTWTLALSCYGMGDYSGAYKYSKQLIEFSEANNINIGGIYYLRFEYILEKLGKSEESNDYLIKGFNSINNLKTIYKYCFLAAYYSYQYDQASALENMKEFAKKDGYAYWTIRNFKDEPIYDNIRNLTEFKQILAEMETKFWKNHKRIKANLEEKGLL